MTRNGQCVSSPARFGRVMEIAHRPTRRGLLAPLIIPWASARQRHARDSVVPTDERVISIEIPHQWRVILAKETLDVFHL